MGLFGGLKWKNQQVRAGDPSEMRMDAMRYDDAGNLMPGGLIQGGETSLETLPGYYEGGDKFTGQDVVKMLLASVSDAGLRNRGHESNAMGNMNQFRLSAIEMAKKAQEQQAQMQAARQRAIAAGVDPARAEMMASGDPNPAEWMPKAGNPYRFEDNAGNVWEIGDDKQPRRIFTDEIPKMYIQGDQAINVPNPWATQGAPTAPVGKLTPLGGAGGNASGGFRGPPHYRR